MNFTGKLKTLFELVFLLNIGVSMASQAPDHIKVLVPRKHVSYNQTMGGPIGSFVYNGFDDRFYISTFGSKRGIRCFVGPDGSFPQWESQEWLVENKLSDSFGKSWQCATESDLSRVAGSLDMAGGFYDSNNKATTIVSGMILNPKPLTVNGTRYDAGKLVILSDNSRASTSSASKRLVTWDLREIWSPTGMDPNSVDPNEFDPSSSQYNPMNLPDRANAEYDSGQLMVDVFGDWAGWGCTNWNDAFNYVLSLQQMADAIGAGEVEVTVSDNVGGRRAAFSSYGKKVYFVSKDSRSFGSRLFTGLWSTNVETGITKRLFNDTGDDGQSVSNRSAVTCSEPGVLAVGLRNLTGVSYNPDYDQVLFNGTEVSGNMAGLNCLVDDGTENPPIHPVIDGAEILDFLETDVYDPAFYGIDNEDPSTWPEEYDPNNPDPATYVDIGDWPKIWSVTADDEGNIYFYMRGPNSLFKFDNQGRLISLKNRPEHIMFNRSLGSTSTNTATSRLQTRRIQAPYDPDETAIKQVMFMASAGRCVAGIDVYPPCDFDRDGSITVADLDFFGTQLSKSESPQTVPAFEDDDFLDYLKADLNASGKINADKTGLYEASVTRKDVQVLYQFIIPGNVNLDDTVDLRDFAVFASNYKSEDTKNWAQGDFDFDGDVDNDDLQLMVSNWLKYDD